jgi:hypothetical protein
MKRVRVTDFPELRRVFAGYLHEDFLEEHASAADAIRAFLADASAVERKRFDREAHRFLQVIRHLESDQALALLDRLGARWRPESRDELAKMLAEIVQANDSI